MVLLNTSEGFLEKGKKVRKPSPRDRNLRIRRHRLWSRRWVLVLRWVLVVCLIPGKSLASLATESTASLPMTFAWPGLQFIVMVRPGCRSSIVKMLLIKISDMTCPGWGLGLVIFFRAAVDSEKILISVWGMWPDIASILRPAMTSANSSAS